jgi:hypothetical protein
MLMVGTIIIENGVPEYGFSYILCMIRLMLTYTSSKGGARISLREPPQLGMVPRNGEQKIPLMCVNPKKKIFQTYSSPQQPRRIKACMKQIVGSPFNSLCEADTSTELDIIDALVEGSKRCWFDPLKTQAYHDRNMASAVGQVISKLRVLVGDKVVRYFDFIASKLFDPKIDLAWDQLNNHCQKFCAKILDFKAFGSFLATTPLCRLHVPKNPLYLISFVCPPGSYDSPRRIRPGTRSEAPNGLTEEYLLRFRCYGHHEDSDHLDTLREYWNDWGAFGGTLYKHQDLFPWDCTEAYRQGGPENSMKCNECSITKHVWSYPFDAWSIAQLHLTRDISLYSPPHGSNNKVLTDDEWMHNRLKVLSALRALTVVAVAMAKTTSFRATCRWNRERKALTPDMASKLDRVKLSGIHRAQPHSHSFEQSKYHDCTLAKWALLGRKDQIKEYEKLRDYRAEQLAEIPPRPLRSNYRDRTGEQNNTQIYQDGRFDINSASHENDIDQHVQEQDSDTDTVVPADYEDEMYDEEYGFEAGGGLIPSSFGPDPEDDYDQYYDTEESRGLNPDSLDLDQDVYYHDQGTGPCDYDQDDAWIDISDGIDDCQDSNNTPSSTDHSGGDFWSTWFNSGENDDSNSGNDDSSSTNDYNSGDGDWGDGDYNDYSYGNGILDSDDYNDFSSGNGFLDGNDYNDYSFGDDYLEGNYDSGYDFGDGYSDSNNNGDSFW